MHLVHSKAGEAEAQAFQAGKTPWERKLFGQLCDQDKNYYIQGDLVQAAMRRKTWPTLLPSSLRVTSFSSCSPGQKILMSKYFT